MKNTFGQSISVTVFGESHGAAIGVVIDGLASGIKIDYDYISSQLELRKAKGDISTKRHEADDFKIVSGVFNGVTCGTPLTILINNTNTKSSDYDDLSHIARPSHADYTGYVKYNGYGDFRGGGHFSGRITAPIVATGALIKSALKNKGIYVGTHILECGGIRDRKFDDYIVDINSLEQKYFPVLDDMAAEKMLAEIKTAASDGDSVGGILQTAVAGLDAGIGEPFFDSLESSISHAVFSVPGVKGIEFGMGFGFAGQRGSTANDEFYMENGTVKTKTNNNGGINGGISNGMPIVFNTVIKPTASIFMPQNTVDFVENKNINYTIKGRHDPAIIHRARIVVSAVTAISIADAACVKFGTDWLSKE